jgi:hypothetical protein
MPNNFVKADWVTMESLRRLINKLEVASYFNSSFSREFTQSFPVGETVQIKLPQRYLIRDGMAYNPQPIDRKTTQVKMDQVFGVDFDWDSVDKALNMERGQSIVREEYIEPAMDQIAQEIDSRCAKYATENCPNVVGALGTTPTAMTPFYQARQRLVEQSCTPGKNGMIISPGMNTSLGTNLTTLLNPQKELSDLFKTGMLGNAAGFKWHESMSIYRVTAGTMTAADVTVSAAPADGATSIVLASAAAGATLKKGDVISFTTPQSVNPSTRRATGAAKTVVLTADCTITGGGTATAYFAPALYGEGSQYQNVDVLPQAGHVVVLYPGTTTPSGLSGINGLALNKDAFALVSVKLEQPKAVEMSSTMRDPKTGIGISFVRWFDGRTRTMSNRFDVLMGFGSLYPENCSVRVASLL